MDRRRARPARRPGGGRLRPRPGLAGPAARGLRRTARAAALPGLVLLLLGLAGAGWAVGAQNVLFIAYAEQHPGGLPGGAGTLLALAALAGLLGALAYGAARWRADTATRTWVLALGMAACYLPLLLLPGPWPMAALALVSGLGLAPLLAAAFVLVAELAPTGTVTEAFAWLVTLFATGNAAGYAVSGALVDTSLHAVALCATGGITLGGLLLLTTRTRLRPTAPAPVPVPA
nr:hypothetical protein [Kitasatospora sp. NA04385]